MALVVAGHICAAGAQSAGPTLERPVLEEEQVQPVVLGWPEFVDYWTYKWCDLLLVSGAKLRPQAVDAYYRWVRRQVADNVPWDRFARDVVTAKGSTFDNGAANFFSLHQDPLNMAETTSMAFLGMSIQCARCHDHPLEKWTNDQYFGMANLFARVRGKGWGGDFRAGDGLRGRSCRGGGWRTLLRHRAVDGCRATSGDRECDQNRYGERAHFPYFSFHCRNRSNA